MNLKEQLKAVQKAMQAIVAGAKASNRDLTDAEMTDLESKSAEAVELKSKIDRAEKSSALIERIGQIKTSEEETLDGGNASNAKTLGAHFIKSVGSDALARARGVNNASVSAPEFKANTDTSATGGAGGALRGLLVEVDTEIVRTPDELTPVSSLLGQGEITVGNAIQYFVEGAIDGDVDTVAEAGAKPQLHIGNPTPELAALAKIAGWTNVTDEYFEDLPLLASEIDNRLTRRLARKVEQQVIAGSGTGSNLRGLLNTPGIQAILDVPAGAVNLADAILDATSMVDEGTGDLGLIADAVLLNRADYVALRKAKDDNGQYYGGGFFTGTYGNGAIIDGSTLWGGLRIAISPFVPKGTALVGALADGATLYGKGGVGVDLTNSHASNFTSNIVTLRAEVRKALAVRVPSAFVRITTASE